MKLPILQKSVVLFFLLFVPGIILLFSDLFFSQSFAGAYQLWEEDANLDPAGAAGAFNAADEFYNPAGMVRMKHPQLSVGIAYLPYNVEFTGEIATVGPLQHVFTKTNDTTSITNAPGGTNNFLPNAHYVTPLGDHWFAGIGITSPFGLATDYSQQLPSNAIVGEAATQTQLLTLNINPSLAYAFNQHFSLGVGFDALWSKQQYNANAIPIPQPPPDPPLFAGATITNNLTGWGYGFNAGALLQYASWRVGFSYRSATKIHGSGENNLGSLPFAPVPVFISSRNLTSMITLPATTLLSFYQELNEKWAWMGTAAYTYWSSASEFVLENLVLGEIIPDLKFSSLTLDDDFKNTLSIIVGVHYKINPNLLLRMALGYDPTPTRDGHRDLRLPDANRVAATLGTHLCVCKNLDLDFAWSHVFIQNANINNIDLINTGGPQILFIPLQTGTVTSSADIFGLQASWMFG